MKDYTNFEDNFGKKYNNYLDLKTYNEVIKLTTESTFRHMFGY